MPVSEREQVEWGQWVRLVDNRQKLKSKALVFGVTINNPLHPQPIKPLKENKQP